MIITEEDCVRVNVEKLESTAITLGFFFRILKMSVPVLVQGISRFSYDIIGSAVYWLRLSR